MAQAAASLELAVPPDEVWDVIGGFGSLPEWLPYIPRSELTQGGRVRSLANPEGATIVERLISYNQNSRSYSYAILEAPFPVTNYQSTLQVVETGDAKSSRVEWFGEFIPSGVSDAEASALFTKIYEDGLRALKRKMTPQPDV